MESAYSTYSIYHQHKQPLSVTSFQLPRRPTLRPRYLASKKLNKENLSAYVNTGYQALALLIPTDLCIQCTFLKLVSVRNKYSLETVEKYNRYTISNSTVNRIPFHQNMEMWEAGNLLLCLLV